jgi:TPR repeat protein
MLGRIIGRIGNARKLLPLLAVFPFLSMIFIAPAFADKRIALVVGNSAYQNVTPLDNPKNDAALMAATLSSLGFTLIGGGAQLNLDKAALDNAVQNFGQQILGADVALFYYAGHGVQVSGANYLVPINANPTREADVDFQMVDINLVLRQMQGAGTRLNLVILDACRNNPFGGRGLRASGGGLAQMRAPEGTLISYATQPGNVAQDGADGDSPYTKALAATIRRSGLDIFQTFNEVGLAVKRSTGGSQQPWVSSSPIDGSFYFVAPPASTPQAVAPAQEARLSEPSDPLQADLVTDCDRLAASNVDPQRPRSISGVLPEKIDIVPALSACNAAMRQYPEVARFAYQAGRIANLQKDYVVARRLYEKAANMGNAASMNNLATLYAGGLGVPKDPAEARKWYEKAAAAGVPFALANLGNLYRDGNGVPKDPAKARKFYEEGAAAGQTNSMANLGYLYQTGNGVPQDYVEARKWYEKAAAADNAGAINALGNLYNAGNGVPKDYAEARKHYEKAASMGNTAGMNNLGNMYRDGNGVPKDPAEARKWYEKAAAAGQTNAMANLGYVYANGLGVPKDPAEARRWYEKAAAAGDFGAMNGLGYLYQTGSGVPKDFVEARKWYEKAAAGGQVVAMANLGNLYRDGNGVPKDYAEARKWYEKAAAGGRPYAMAALGSLYEKGQGVSKNEDEARKWYEKAAAAGSEFAKTALKQLDSRRRK